MTVYLLDENVLRELRPGGNASVRAWYASVSDADLRVSVVTFFEKRRGWERKKKSDVALATAKLAELDVLEATYASRIVPIDVPVVAEWARLLGTREKDKLDFALAATARVHGYVLVTRNTKDVRGCLVQVLNPFERDPGIEVV